MALLFEIDAHGRLAPVGDETRRALADRAGRFALLPAAPDLLLALRTPATGEPASGARCRLAGDLSAFPVADFLGFVHAARLSGTLTVASGGVERSVFFQDGEVRGAQSEGAGERIGEVALRLGFLQAEQLDQAAGLARPFGKALVEKGFLRPADLWKCLHEQVTAVFHGILQARSGVFAMVERSGVELPGTPLAVNTQQLLMDGIRRLDEMSLFRTRIPGPQAWLRRRQPRRSVTLTNLEQLLLDKVDGRRQLTDIARQAHLSEFDATKILFHLAEAGYVEAVAGPAAAQPADPQERLGEIVAGMNAIYREVALQMTAARALDPLLAAAHGFLADPAGRFPALWSGVALGRDATVDAAALLGNLGEARRAAAGRGDAAGDPARLLFDGMRELLFFLLFQAGERLAREADEALSAEVKRRLEALGGLR